MPQLDLFTLLFQFKSFFITFSVIYFLFVFIFVPRLHFIISLRRLQILNFLNYNNFLKLIVYSSFSSQCSFLKNYLLFFNSNFSLYFTNYLDSKFSISNFLFSNISF